MGSGETVNGEGGRSGFASEVTAVFLRVIASLLSIAGLLVLVKDEETAGQTVGGQTYTTTVKYSYSSGFLYLVYTNGLVAAYCCLIAVSSTVCLISHAAGERRSAWMIFVLDQMLVYALLAAASASSEVVYILDNGNPKTQWESLCNVYMRFCGMAKASILLSFLSAVVLAFIAVISACRLFKKYSRCMVKGTYLSAS